MDINEFIESGMLESYVSGLLSDSELEYVEQMAEKHPEIKQEIHAIRSSLNNYSRSSARMPSSAILGGALEQITSDQQGEEESELDDEQTVAAIPAPDSRDWFKLVASFALIISVGANAFLFNQWKLAEQEQELTEQQLFASNNQLEILTGVANKEIPLRGLDISPSSFATVYISEETRDVYIKIGDLPPPPSGHQYQLWADRDGHMHNIGVFHHNSKLQHLAVFEGDFESLNVTLEEEGGSETATVERAYLSGKAQS